jgi:hypothetical protein
VGTAVGRARAGRAPVSDPPDRSKRAVFTATWLFAISVLLGLVLYSTQFSGIAQWAAGVAFLAVLTAYATYAVGRRTERLEPFPRSRSDHEILEGELSILRATVERADRGLSFSRDALVARVRDAARERIRGERGLSPEAFQDLEATPAALRDVARDDVIGSFLVETAGRGGRSAWADSAGRGLSDSLRDILDRMEALR